MDLLFFCTFVYVIQEMRYDQPDIFQRFSRFFHCFLLNLEKSPFFIYLVQSAAKRKLTNHCVPITIVSWNETIRMENSGKKTNHHHFYEKFSIPYQYFMWKWCFLLRCYISFYWILKFLEGVGLNAIDVIFLWKEKIFLSGFYSKSNLDVSVW